MTNFIISLAWLLIFRLLSSVHGLGSMGTMAASYGDNGATLCGLSAGGSHYAECYGGDAAIVFAAPLRMPFEGLSAGAGFVCGIQITTRQPYCWGNSFYVRMGIPQPLPRGIAYAEVSAGDHHFCALRAEGFDIVDCWGYNMTGSLAFGSSLRSLSSGSMFSCAVFVANGTAVCWGDETGSGVVSLLPKHVRFKSVSAGGYYVCGIDTEDKTLCWGQSMVDVGLPREKMSYIVGGRFQACGILSQTRGIVCWGLVIPGNPTKPPLVRFASIVAGDYFTCGVVAGSTNTVCWGADCPKSGPLAVTPMSCSLVPCADGSFNDPKQCEAPYHACVPCSVSCPDGMRVVKECSGVTDRVCGFVCSVCEGNVECLQHCAKRKRRFSFHGLLIVAVLSVLIVVASVCTFVIAFCLKMRSCSPAPLPKTPKRTRPPKICRAQVFSYVELERATGGFCKDSEVGRGSYSCVFKGELSDGRVVAVKRAMIAGNTKRDSKEFHREVDLLSRLNHAHLLNLLGYCEEGGERLLVYEYMAHGSLHEHLHGNSKEKLDWIRRVTIAVQAARGLEYLHGYACPPVIHRDIKSSNILIDEERNARVADFGLSLLGPVDSDTPLSELPAGTLGYLDPEYYRLHYLTTKSDVYSFGVLLLEILSGRKAIDMRYEPGNIVEWAVPLVKTKDIEALLDSRLDPPDNIDALHRIARVACRCVRMRGKERPSMDKVTTSLERSLAQLMGTPCDDQPILPTEVVLGSSRLHNKSSGSHDLELRAPSWITFPSVASSQRRKSSVSEDTKAVAAAEDHRREKERDKDKLSEEEQDEIRSVSPQRDLYLQNNF